MGGHSYGELVALHAAGVAERDGAWPSSRWHAAASCGRRPGIVAGAMAALLAGPDDVERLIRDVPGVQAANWNGPRQTVIAGPALAVKEALDLAATRGIQGRALTGRMCIPYPAGRLGSRTAGTLRRPVTRPVSGSAGLLQSRCRPPSRPTQWRSRRGWAIISPAPYGLAT